MHRNVGRKHQVMMFNAVE